MCMKRILKFIFAIPFLILPSFSLSVMAQPISSGNTGTQSESRPPEGAGSAPIGSGIFLLLVMAAAYGVKKTFEVRNSSVEKVSSEQQDLRPDPD